MNRLTTFYDRYHTKNSFFHHVIGRNNFTYFYILQLLDMAGLQGMSGTKILDVGCGVGTMSLYCASQGAEVVGIDVSPRAIEIAEQARQSLKLPNGTFRQGELANGKPGFDVALCFEVLEHVKNEHAFLSAISSHLKTGGRLLLSTPSSDSVMYRQGWYQQFDTEVGHLRRYTPTRLEKVLRQAGFEVVLMRQVEGILRNSLYTTRLGFLIRFIRGPLVSLFHVLDRVSGQVMGYTDIQVVARKI